MTLKTDRWYLVPGINLIMLRHTLLSLAEDLRSGRHMSLDELLDRLARALEYIPDDPPEAF